MQASQIELSELKPEHIDGALALSRAAGWPHRREDWLLVLSLSHGAVALEEGRVVGTAMTTLFGTGSSTINMVIVDETIRGRGLGRRLMDFALQAAEGRQCRLIATKEGLPLYEKLGFRETGRILQHQGKLHQTAAAADDGVQWAMPGDVAEFASMDRDACGMDRTALMDLLAIEGRFAVLRENGEIKGFAGLRPFGRGELAGPVVCENAQAACRLLSFVFAGRTGAFMRVDTFETCGLADWLVEQGLLPAGGGISMQKSAGEPHKAIRFQSFALASQALG